MSTIVGTSTSDNQLPEAVPTYPEPRIDVLRKVQISVERPYQADNDSDSERGTSALRAKKQNAASRVLQPHPIVARARENPYRRARRSGQ